MKQLFAILFLGLILTGCQKEEVDSRDIYVGNWDFEVTYTSNVGNEMRESVFDCQGMISKGSNKESLSLHHCINDSLKIMINEEGVVYSLMNELMGVIDQETCLIVDNNPTEKSISKVTIKGTK
jgi:hypothetical protein